MLATRPIKAGELLMISSPLLFSTCAEGDIPLIEELQQQ